MIGSHYKDWELLAFIDQNQAVSLEEIAAHLSDCEGCRRELESLRKFWAAMNDPAAHHYAKLDVKEPDPAAVAHLEAMSAIIQAEDDLAAELMQRLRCEPLSVWRDILSTVPEQRTEGLVRKLIAEARATFERDPQRALAVLDVARSVSDGLGDMFALAGQRAAVAKERANALRILGRNQEALQELDWAERFLRHLPVHAFELALVDWTRATVLLHMTRYDEALGRARRANKVLREHGETTRAEQVRLIEAGILYEQGQVVTALRIYEELARFFAGSEDTLTRARIEANIAECQMRFSAWTAVQQHGAAAIELFRVVGNETEVVRVRWTLAHSLLGQGRFAEGLRSLKGLESAFLQLGMQTEAAEVLLDIVEVHLRRSEWSEAIAVATRAAEQFTRMDSPVHVAQAYAHLRDAVAARQATVGLVQYVRDYVASLEIPAAFEPPAPGPAPN